MINIIGAGPAGNYAAYLLANDHNVEVHEEHKTIGDPIQCTGIMTPDLKNLIKVSREFLINKIKRVKVYSKNEESFFNLKRPNYVVDRKFFDSHIADMARDRGAKYVLNSRFLGCKVENNINVRFNNGNNECDYLVGADGPHSSVAKSVGIYGKRRFYVGLQATVKKKYEPDLVEFYIGKHYIGWVVPENEKFARVGVSSETISGPMFKEVMKLAGGEIVGRQAGAIPIYEDGIKTSYKNKVFLVGDAAAQVKASTHGGIIPGMIAATQLCEAIKTGKNYDKLWKKKIWKDLKIHSMIKKMMDNFNDNDFDYLLKLMNKDAVRKIVEEHDREFPSRFAFKLLMKEPRFLKFLTKLI